MAKQEFKISPQYTREIAFNGRLRTADDPATIGQGDFQTLSNIRYTDTGIRGIGGMTKINTVAVTNPIIKSGIHFKKDLVAENFVLVQGYNSSTAAPALYSCTAVPPATGSFSSLYTQNTAAASARFSTGPGGNVIICDGKEALIYGGTEMKIGSFIDYDPNGTYRYDYTRQVTNNLTDTNNLATVHRATGALDSNTVLLLTFDSTAQDTSPTTPHNMGIVNLVYSAASAKFGVAAAAFNGSACCSAADNADFNFSGGNWTIDFWSNPLHVSTDRYLYYQGTDDGNYFQIKHINQADRYWKIGVTAQSASAILFSFVSSPQYLDGNYHHVEVNENGDNYRIFIDGNQKAIYSVTGRVADYTGNVYIGSDSSVQNGYNGYIDEFRISNTTRHTSDFDPPTQPYSGGFMSSFLVGSTLPAKGIKFYVASANTATGASVVNYWNGTSWSPAGGLTDGTSSASKPLAQTGTMAFTSTATAAKLRAEDDLLLYWYKVEITNQDASAQISQVTVDVPVQTIKDIWDGSWYDIGAFHVFKGSAYNDYTTNVFEDAYDATNQATYADISSLPASASYLYAGFPDRMQGVKFGVVAASGNTTASTVNVEYYNGGDPTLASGWTSLTVSDLTVTNNCSLGQSGMVTWQSPAPTSEFKTYLAGVAGRVNVLTTNVQLPGTRLLPGQIPSIQWNELIRTGDPSTPVTVMALYYYRFSFSNGLDSSTALYNVVGIQAQEDLRGYKFPVHHADRVWLCNNVDSEPNAVVCSSVNTAQVFNGGDSTKIYIGNNEGLTAGASLYSRFGSNAYNLLALCKQNETWAVLGENPENFVIFRVSDSVGCVAPMTMATISLGEGNVPGLSRNLAIWQSANGIVAFDGTNITTLSNDISDKFDPRSANAIPAGYINASYGFYDPVYHEYHFLCVGAGASEINEEWVYDLRRSKWWQASRPNPLTCGFMARGNTGDTYVYGADNTGFVFRLENGNDMNGSGITQTFQTGDIALHKGSIIDKTEIDWGLLVTKAKSNATGTIAVTHYGDGITTGTSFNTVDPTKSGYRIVDTSIHNKSGKRTFHSLKFSMTTNDETYGFEPLYYAATYRVYRREA